MGPSYVDVAKDVSRIRFATEHQFKPKARLGGSFVVWVKMCWDHGTMSLIVQFLASLMRCGVLQVVGFHAPVDPVCPGVENQRILVSTGDSDP